MERCSKRRYIFSGATTNTLTLTNVLINYDGYEYRCVVTNAEGSVNSNSAKLTVQSPDGFPYWIISIVIAALLMIIFFIIIVDKKRKKRKDR